MPLQAGRWILNATHQGVWAGKGEEGSAMPLKAGDALSKGLTRDHGLGEGEVEVPCRRRLGVAAEGVGVAVVAQELPHPPAPCPLHSCLRPAQALPMRHSHQHMGLAMMSSDVEALRVQQGSADQDFELP